MGGKIGAEFRRNYSMKNHPFSLAANIIQNLLCVVIPEFKKQHSIPWIIKGHSIQKLDK
jgi:hypothetical protein